MKSLLGPLRGSAPTRCRDLAASVTAYLDGDLDDATASACRGHLRTCADCRALAEDHARIRDGLADLERVEPPAALWSQISARLGEAEIADARRAPASQLWARLRPIVWPAAVTASACAIAIVMVQWKRSPASQPRERDVLRTATATATDPLPDAPVVQVPLRDATAELADEERRVEERFRATAAELLTLARAEIARAPAVQARKFNLEVASREKAVLNAAPGRARDRAWHALTAYLEQVVLGDLVAIGDTAPRSGGLP
jgi:anti-sigma factor RsiW